MNPRLERIPGPSAVAQVADLHVLNQTGQSIKFGSIFEEQKTVVVFIRHFFCGSCQAYVGELSKVPSGKLESAGVKLVVIGCGEWNPIKAYSEITGFRCPIYADPTRKLYNALGMDIETLDRTPAGQQKRSYLSSGFLSDVMLSIWRGPLKHPFLIGKQGNISQLGGEFVFGPGNHCSFASRMQHTEDHVEVADLMRAAGVQLEQ